MKKTMKIKAILSALVFCTVNAFAQQSLHQVIVLNEGRYNYILQQIDKPVTIGTYNPQTNVYSVFDTIDNARFASDVVVDDANIYVSADNTLLKYDLNTHQLISTQTVNGIRKLALWNDKILLTRGEYQTTYDSYFQVYNKADLSFVYQLDTLNGPHYASDGIVVKDNTAYIAINNGFVWGGAVGIVGRVDLSNQNYLAEISLGVDGINPENILIDNNKIYTVNNRDYSYASISSVDISNASVITTNLNNAGGCQGSALINSRIAYQTYNENFIGRFDVTTQNISDSLFINRSVYAMATDVVNEQLYASETDFSSYGLVLIYSSNGNLMNAFVAGVTPGKFAFDYRSATGMSNAIVLSQLMVFPNPATSQLTIAGTCTEKNSSIVITSIDGRIMYEEVVNENNFVRHIDIAAFASGTYLLSIKSEHNSSVQKVVKY